MKTVNGDRELLSDLIQAFLDESPGLLSSLKEALSQDDAETFRTAAHTLKGSLRYLGAEEAFEVAFRLEKLPKENRLGEAGPELAKLDALVAQITPLLVNYLSTGRTDNSSKDVSEGD